MRICAVVLLAMLASSSCSLVFRDADPSQGEQCLGVRRFYERGDRILENRYSRIDYRQGTLTFWVQALKLISDATPLVSLAGIAVIAHPEGIILSFSGGGTTTVPISDPLAEEGIEHFVALRWDTNQPLSGTNGSHVELRMDGEVVYSGFPEPFTVTPSDTQPVFSIGDADGRVHVDQVVLYDRPLFVVGNSTQKDGELDLLNDRRVSPRVADGGFDVLFATVSPGDFGCEDYAAEAWAFRDNALLKGGNLKLAPESVLFDMPPPTLPDAEQVYPGGGIRVSEGAGASFSVEVTGNSSYVLELLTHSIRNAGEVAVGKPIVDVAPSSEPANPLVHYAGTEAGTREDPRRSIVTFQAPEGVTDVKIVLGAIEGAVAFDSITLHPNLFVEAGFEDREFVSADTWRLNNNEAKVPVDKTTLAPPEAYAGDTSVCLTSIGSPAVILQEPRSTFPDKALMADNELYLFGAQFLWQAGDAPSVNIGNGSLFATGGPYDQTTKAGTSTVRKGQWETVSSVGRRLLNSEFNNHNDIIRFGTGYNNGAPSNFCLDSAYNIELEHIVQDNGTGLLGP